MKKILTSAVALAFIAGMGLSTPSFAAKHMAEACKGKKAGDTVKVDGKDVKCPDAKKK
jgi:hypothetical protein